MVVEDADVSQGAIAELDAVSDPAPKSTTSVFSRKKNGEFKELERVIAKKARVAARKTGKKSRKAFKHSQKQKKRSRIPKRGRFATNIASEIVATLMSDETGFLDAVADRVALRMMQGADSADLFVPVAEHAEMSPSSSEFVMIDAAKDVPETLPEDDDTPKDDLVSSADTSPSVEPSAPAVDVEPPPSLDAFAAAVDSHAQQLLFSMGFCCREENEALLRKLKGNVQRVVDVLLQRPTKMC